MRLLTWLILTPIILLLFILLFPIIFKLLIVIPILSMIVFFLTLLYCLITNTSYSHIKDMNRFYLYYICKIGEISFLFSICIIIFNYFFDINAILNLLKVIFF